MTQNPQADRPALPASAVPQRPLRHTPSQIRSRLKLYRVSAILTGTFLILLVIEMIAKWGFHYELHVGGVNLSKAVLIIHGWLYVFYLFADFQLYSALRWRLGRFLLIALGGVVPFLSFFLEGKVHREVEALLETIEPAGPRY